MLHRRWTTPETYSGKLELQATMIDNYFEQTIRFIIYKHIYNKHSNKFNLVSQKMVLTYESREIYPCLNTIWLKQVNFLQVSTF